MQQQRDAMFTDGLTYTYPTGYAQKTENTRKNIILQAKPSGIMFFQGSPPCIRLLSAASWIRGNNLTALCEPPVEYDGILLPIFI